MNNTTLVRTALFVLCTTCRYSAADRDRTGDYRLYKHLGGQEHSGMQSPKYIRVCLAGAYLASARRCGLASGGEKLGHSA